MPKRIGFGTRVAWATVFAVVLAVMLGLLLAAKPVHAKTFTIDFKGDSSDIAPGDGVCDASPSQFVILCTLRAAIQEANAYPGADAIHFALPEGGVQTITPASGLPAITGKVTIDGYTQPGASPNTNAQGAINAKPLIELDGSNAGYGASGLFVFSGSGSVVKGLVINGFYGTGIFLSGSNHRVEGNFIGTDATGTQDLGNEWVGVDMSSGPITIGEDTPATRNIISGNGYEGIRIKHSSGVEVQGNLIGTDKSATADLGNSSYGVLIYNWTDSEDPVSPTTNVTVGGSANTRNTIAFNGEDGVGVWDSSRSIYILYNSIHSNGDLGVDLGYDGATPNDLKDPDTGANGLQNTPTITSATTSGGKTTIEGKLNSLPSRGFIVQFFSNPVGDEGEKFVAEKSVTTNASGNATFSFIVPKLTVPDGQNVTATATGREGTSEFSSTQSVQ